ncbi:MAG TPA: hypothetical protein VF760_13210, partial [Xanthobacteraceae bacterium]
MACHTIRIDQLGVIALPRENGSATLASRTVSRRTYIPVPAIPIRAGAEQQRPELIHQDGIIYSFGSSLSCARSLRVARVR